jgi:hypothetical protein
MSNKLKELRPHQKIDITARTPKEQTAYWAGFAAGFYRAVGQGRDKLGQMTVHQWIPEADRDRY